MQSKGEPIDVDDWFGDVEEVVAPPTDNGHKPMRKRTRTRTRVRPGTSEQPIDLVSDEEEANLRPSLSANANATAGPSRSRGAGGVASNAGNVASAGPPLDGLAV